MCGHHFSLSKPKVGQALASLSEGARERGEEVSRGEREDLGHEFLGVAARLLNNAAPGIQIP